MGELKIDITVPEGSELDLHLQIVQRASGVARVSDDERDESEPRIVHNGIQGFPEGK